MASKTVTIGVEEFEIPLTGENPDYSESLSDFFVAVADSLQTVVQPNDILVTSASINNNISSFTDIPGFFFNTAEVRSINSEFLIKRTTDIPSVNLVCNGTIQGHYTGSEWKIVVETIGNAEVELDIDATGQVQYKSSNLTGSNYSGSITFKAKVINESN